MARPCGSCPYRKDVPSGVWHPSEYARLIPYDRPTAEQPISMFGCHQQNGHVCAGWAGCHDMEESLSLRMAAAFGHMTPVDYEATLDYQTDVELFESGMDAAAHGMTEVEEPSPRAETVIRNLERKLNG